MAEFQGTVAWCNNAEGYGFLTHPDSQDVFCHSLAGRKEGYKTLLEGDQVEFDIVQGGRQAANVIWLKRSRAQQGGRQ